jgi:hypothetical protein
MAEVMREWKEHAMNTLKTAAVFALLYGLATTAPAYGEDESKLNDATRQVESGAKTAGEGIKDTAKGVGNTVVEGAKVAGDRMKEAGRAAEPEAKSAWDHVKEGATAFGHSVKNFFTRLAGR